MQKGKKPTVRWGPQGKPAIAWVDPHTLRPGPIRHPDLSDKQLATIRSIHDVLAEVDGLSFDSRVDCFKRDLHIDRELDFMTAIATAYRQFIGEQRVSAEARKDVLHVLLLRSMTTPGEVADRVRGGHLSDDQVAEVMGLFEAAIPKEPDA
jgi:hypothetical protein